MFMFNQILNDCHFIGSRYADEYAELVLVRMKYKYMNN